MMKHPDFERTDEYTNHYVEGLEHPVNLTNLMAEFFSVRPDVAKALGLNISEKSNPDPIKSRLSSLELDMKLIKGGVPANPNHYSGKILSDEELEAVISPKKVRDEQKVNGDSPKINSKKIMSQEPRNVVKVGK